MQILMPVLWFDEVPGSWTYFYEEAEQLARAGNRVVVLSPHHGGAYQGTTSVRVYRYNAIYLQQLPLYLINFLSFISAVRRATTEEGLPDLIYDTTSGVLPASILCKSWFKLTRTKVPILLHVHGELKDLQSRGLFSLLFELSLNTIARISYRIADRVLIAGARIYPRVVRLGAKPSKIAIVHVGTKYTQEPRPISQQEAIQLRKTLGLQERDFVIGHVGRPSRAKGVERLLEAFAIVKTRVTDAKLVVVGEGGERTLMQALSHNLKLTEDVKFLGQRDDVMELLRIMDTFVNLSQSEAGISASQIEAMQAGLPSVVTPFSDLIENMKEAIVVQPGDIQAIANAIVRLHDDEPLRIVMGQNAVAKARNLRLLYSWDEYLRKMASLFEEFK